MAMRKPSKCRRFRHSPGTNRGLHSSRLPRKKGFGTHRRMTTKAQLAPTVLVVPVPTLILGTPVETANGIVECDLWPLSAH
jgi:hypothetical protein